MRQFRTENPIILAKEDVSKTPEFYKKGFNDAKILKPYRAHFYRMCKEGRRNDALETIFIKQIFKGENSNGRDE